MKNVHSQMAGPTPQLMHLFLVHACISCLKHSIAKCAQVMSMCQPVTGTNEPEVVCFDRQLKTMVCCMWCPTSAASGSHL